MPEVCKGGIAAHLEITRRICLKNQDKVVVYFADSYCSWQKGAIENANKLIRKYIPKKSNFDDFSDKQIMEIQKELNRCPREKINCDSPKARFFNLVRLLCICCWTLYILKPKIFFTKNAMYALYLTIFC